MTFHMQNNSSKNVTEPGNLICTVTDKGYDSEEIDELIRYTPDSCPLNPVRKQKRENAFLDITGKSLQSV